MAGRAGARLWALVAALLVLGALWWGGADEQPAPGVGDGASAVDDSGIPYVQLEDLPPEAAEMVALIDAGGPYEHAGKDGSTFGNYEGHLPQRQRGYYREYTVDTPGLSHRGARRIVTGDDGEFYWTADHYASFERIRR